MEPNIWNTGRRGTKNDIKLEAPGRDQTAAFWLKEFTETQVYLAILFNELIEESQILDWLTTEVTNRFPKNENTKRPKNYLPVTCLPTV